MTELIEYLIKESLINKSSLLKFILDNPNTSIDIKKLLNNNLLEESKLYEFLLIKIKEGLFSFDIIESLEAEGLNSIKFYKYVANSLNIEYVDLNDQEIDSALLNKIPISFLLKNRAVVIKDDDLYTLVVFADPFDLAAQDAIARFFPKKLIKVGISQTLDIRDKLVQIETYESLKSYVEEIKKDLETSADSDYNESPAVLKLIDLILQSSILARASDIHIEATEKNCIVRDRIDGMLQQRFIFDKIVFGPLSSRIKLLSNLDIAERRKPQDGRFSAEVLDKEFDFRISTLPTLVGESIVMRILDKSKTLIALEEMGMSDDSYDKFKNSIKMPHGIVLVTGPTGSGKTTTLYASLNAIKSIKDKIITIEDPVEYRITGIQQSQVNNSAGLTFASALRSILRQDPDKIMIGEIRDKETLRIAIQAAMTGHLVFSTLHTNDAISAIYRMIDMGIESYLISGSLIAIQAQRLVRKICSECKVRSEISGSILNKIKQYIPEDRELILYKGTGCKNCLYTGYLGREMISEVLVISNKLSRMIASESTREEIEKQAKKEGFLGMFEDGIEKALEGKTTVDEIFRVARL